uniref:Uncharacterized protein n=1 Tax=Desulfatirhabdium butyrativorans TaxID=340467 RepID=A0A7C4MQ91_9BACT
MKIDCKHLVNIVKNQDMSFDGVRSQESGVRSQESGVRSQESGSGEKRIRSIFDEPSVSDHL